MISLVTPILMSFVTSKKVKVLIIKLLEALAAKTENTLDDAAVAVVRDALLPKT